jgi:hypothetical protein
MSNPNNESAEDARARRGRNRLLAAALLVFVGIIFAVTIAKIGGNIGHSW